MAEVTAATAAVDIHDRYRSHRYRYRWSVVFKMDRSSMRIRWRRIRWRRS